jgi:ABC-2 type transport system ATP-binding protein
MSPVIRTENLVKKFRRVEALNGLNLEVPQGAIYALVGPNGAGKTTAIKILMNIFAASSGHAEVLGVDSKRIGGDEFAAIGYVSENQQLPEWMRVDEFLAYLRPFYPAWDRALEDQLVRQLALPLKRKLRELSRGMRMKAALASALAYRPRLIVMDEPFSGLDPLVRDELIEGILERAEEATIFISSHDLAEIENLASHCGYLEQGRLLFSEEMPALVERFREVELTFNTPPALPPSYPSSWMRVNSSGAVVQFIESRFVSERTNAEINRVLGEPRMATFAPMSLRSIFLAVAKTKERAGSRMNNAAREAHKTE